MKRVNFYLPQQQLSRLRSISEKTGLPVSELVRRAIEDYLKRQGKNSDSKTA